MTGANARLTTEEGRSVLRLERHLSAAPEHVWRALTEPDDLAAWFPSRVKIELRVGGRVTFLDFDGPDESSGHVTHLVVGRRLAFTWAEDHLDFELTPTGDGTRLSLTHTFDDRAGAASFAAGWVVCLDALHRGAEPHATVPDRDPQALHEVFIRELGLDAGTLRRDGSRWEVTYERQLVVPLDVAGDSVGTPLRDALPATAKIELTPGTGHGARLRVALTGEDGDGEKVLALVREAVENQAADAAGASRTGQG